jgi:hypothetical protein
MLTFLHEQQRKRDEESAAAARHARRTGGMLAVQRQQVGHRKLERWQCLQSLEHMVANEHELFADGCRGSEEQWQQLR